MKPTIYILLFLSILSNGLYAENIDSVILHYINLAKENNSQLSADHRQWQSAIEKIDYVTKLPTPQLTMGYFLENVETAVGPQEYKIGLAQKLPWFGKLSTTKKIQIHRAEIAHLKLMASTDQITFQIKAAVYKLALINEKIKITSENLALLQQWQKILNAKYQSESIRYTDVIKVEQEIYQLEEQLASLKKSRDKVILNLEAIIEAEPINPETLSIPKSIGKTTYSGSSEQVLKHNRQFQIATLKKQIAKLTVKRANQHFIPDAGVGVDYILTGDKYQSNGNQVSESGKNPMVFMVSLDLPLQWGKIKKGIKAAEYQENSLEAQEAEVRKRILTRLEQLSITLQDLKSRLNVYNDKIIPATERQLALQTVDLKTDRVNIYQLIETQRDLLDYQLTSAEILANYHITRAKQSKLSGSTLR